MKPKKKPREKPREKVKFCQDCMAKDAIISYLIGKMRKHALIAEQDRERIK